jgi:hypothetical protein
VVFDDALVDPFASKEEPLDGFFWVRRVVLEVEDLVEALSAVLEVAAALEEVLGIDKCIRLVEEVYIVYYTKDFESTPYPTFYDFMIYYPFGTALSAPNFSSSEKVHTRQYSPIPPHSGSPPLWTRPQSLPVHH